LQTIATGQITINRSGFIYVYTSNESLEDVFFDNLVVQHFSGPVLEETHYYPFGLTMEGISSKAIYNPENSILYNDKELQEKEFRGNGGRDWNGMIMERGCMISRLGGGMWLTPWQKKEVG
jgi:hypothetical protein